jgi:predicted glycosyltransferase involved in capsule biosynthesis
MAAYKSDIVRAGGFNTRIHGWGKEDVDLYSKCLKVGLSITRATDPNLVHVYHQASSLSLLYRNYNENVLHKNCTNTGKLIRID